MDFRRLINSFGFAARGILDLFQHHQNAQIHLGVSIIVVIFGFLLDISPIEWIALVVCMALVIALEGINSAIEYLTDLVSPNHHPLAGKAKDIAAGAVLWAVMGAIIVGGIIFFPKIYAWLYP